MYRCNIHFYHNSSLTLVIHLQQLQSIHTIITVVILIIHAYMYTVQITPTLLKFNCYKIVELCCRYIVTMYCVITTNNYNVCSLFVVYVFQLSVHHFSRKKNCVLTCIF